LLIRMPLDPAKAFSKRLSVAMLAAGADLGAAADRVPGRVGPFDVGVLAHELFTISLSISRLRYLFAYY
jgi:hypothetical protein